MPINSVITCPTYYYYQGTECNGYNTYTFRSLTAVTASVVKIPGDICLSSITTGASNSTDIVATYSDCASCLPANVTIDTCSSSYSNGSYVVEAFAYASEPVNTGVTVQLRWTGDLGSVINFFIYISSSNTCGSQYDFANYIGEYASTVEILNIAPSSSGNQIYNPGSNSTSPMCTSC